MLSELLHNDSFLEAVAMTGFRAITEKRTRDDYTHAQKNNNKKNQSEKCWNEINIFFQLVNECSLELCSKESFMMLKTTLWHLWKQV